MTELRENYEQALDEAESRRQAYAESIREARASGKDPVELAELTGMSPARISMLTGTKSRPHLRRIYKMIIFLLVIPLAIGAGLMELAPRPTTSFVSARLSADTGTAVAKEVADIPGVRSVAFGPTHGTDPTLSYEHSRGAVGSHLAIAVNDPEAAEGASEPWSLRVESFDSTNQKELKSVEDGVLTAIPAASEVRVRRFRRTYGQSVGSASQTTGTWFKLGNSLIYVTFIGWAIYGLIVLVRFVHKRWRLKLIRVEGVSA